MAEAAGAEVSEKRKAKNKGMPAKPWALTGCKAREPNIVKSFYLKEGDLERFNLKLQKKYTEIKNKEQRWEELFLSDAKIILVAYGTMARIAKSALAQLRLQGKKVGLIRPITLWPFPEKAFRAPGAKSKIKKILTIEMSTGQMVEDVKLTVNGKIPIEFLGRAGGGVPSEKEIINKVNRLL